jgi:hypothetical protein
MTTSISKYYFGTAQIRNYTDKTELDFTDPDGVVTGIVTGLKKATQDADAVNYSQLKVLESDITTLTKDLDDNYYKKTSVYTKTEVDTKIANFATDSTITDINTKITALQGTINSLNSLLFGPNTCENVTNTAITYVQGTTTSP